MKSQFVCAPLLLLACLLFLGDAAAAQTGQPGQVPEAKLQEFGRRLRDARHQGRLREVLSMISQAPPPLQREERVLGEQIQALLDMGEVDDARAVAASVAEVADLKDGVPPTLAIALVRLQFARGDAHAARKTAEVIAVQVPGNSDLRALLAQLDIAEGDYARAEAAFPTFAGSVAPQFATEVECSLSLAKAAELMSDDALVGRAVPLLEATLAKAPHRADVRALLARALVRWQRFEQADEVLAAGFALDQGDDELPAGDKQVRSGKTTLDDAERAELLYASGFLARARLDDTAARAAYEQVLDLVPGHPKGLVGLARILGDEGDLDGARELLERCLEASPSDPDALLTLGDVEAEAGDLDASEAALRRLLDARPNHLKALWQLSRVLARRGGAAGDEVEVLVTRYEERKRVLEGR